MANRYFISGGTGNYNSTTNWSTTSGGVSGSTVPTAADDVFVDSNSANMTVNVASVAKTLTVSAAKTITMTSTLSVSGNITMFSGMTWAGSGALTVATTATITSNGKYYPNTINLNGTSSTFTLSGDLRTNNVLFDSNSKTINGSDLYTNGGLSAPGNTGNIQGTSTIFLLGTGTLIAAGGSYFANNITISATGTTTISGTFNYRTGTFRHITGSTVTTNSTLSLLLSAKLYTSGMTWNNITFGSNSLSDNDFINISNTLTAPQTVANVLFAGGFTCANLIMGAGNVGLSTGQTYTVTTSMVSNVSTLAAKALLFSRTSGTKAIFNLLPGATQDNGYLSATDIDSSGGRSIWTYKGTLSNTINWNQLSTNPKKHVLKSNNRILKHT